MTAKIEAHTSDRPSVLIIAAVILALPAAMLFGCAADNNDDDAATRTIPGPPVAEDSPTISSVDPPSTPAATSDGGSTTSQEATSSSMTEPLVGTEPVQEEVESVTLGYLQGTNLSAIPVFAAQNGFFEAEGIDVELIPHTTSAAGIALILSGDADIVSGIGPPAVVGASAEGACVRILGVDQTNSLDLGARPDLELPNAGKPYPEPLLDVRGMTVGVPAIGGNAELQIRALLRDAGIDPDADGVEFVAVGGPPTAAVALQQSQVDMVYLVPPMQSVLGEAGFQYVVRLVGETGHALEDLITSFTVTSCETAEQKPGLIDRYCTAISLAVEYAQNPANVAEMSAFTAELLAVEAGVGTEIWEQYASTYPGPILDSATWEAQAEFLPAGLTLPVYNDLVYGPCASGGD